MRKGIKGAGGRGVLEIAQTRRISKLTEMGYTSKA